MKEKELVDKVLDLFKEAGLSIKDAIIILEKIQARLLDSKIS